MDVWLGDSNYEACKKSIKEPQNIGREEEDSCYGVSPDDQNYEVCVARVEARSAGAPKISREPAPSEVTTSTLPPAGLPLANYQIGPKVRKIEIVIYGPDGKEILRYSSPVIDPATGASPDPNKRYTSEQRAGFQVGTVPVSQYVGQSTNSATMQDAINTAWAAQGKAGPPPQVADNIGGGPDDFTYDPNTGLIEIHLVRGDSAEPTTQGAGSGNTGTPTPPGGSEETGGVARLPSSTGGSTPAPGGGGGSVGADTGSNAGGGARGNTESNPDSNSGGGSAGASSGSAVNPFMKMLSQLLGPLLNAFGLGGSGTSQTSPKPQPKPPVQVTPSTTAKPTSKSVAILIANPSLLRGKGTTRLSWATISSRDCVLQGGGINNSVVPNGATTSPEIKQTTGFSLSCVTTDGGALRAFATTTVEVIQ